MSDISLERRPDGVAILRLDRPKLNPLSLSLLAEIEGAVSELSYDPPGAVVVWGGERCFSAGADVSEFGGSERAAEVAAGFHRALDALAALPRATITAITGYALGGGLELALACDFRFAGDGARLGQPEILLGVIPGGGGTQRLARLIGSSRAKDLIFTGRQVKADEALSMGLVDRVVAPEAVFDEALQYATSLASGAVAAQGLAKRAIDEGLSAGLTEGLATERQLFSEVFETEDAGTGVRSFLAEGPGKARFSGR
ncbi:MAG: enoyl-CoA hydratase/isomerase family protein [Acidimicrobiales bacterium]